MKTVSLVQTEESNHPLPSAPPLANPSAAGEVAALKDWCLARADEWYDRGELGAARDFLKHAADIDSRDARVWIALGSLEYELARFNEAGLAFVRAGELEPANAQVFLHLGLVHQKLKQFPEAEAVFRHAHELQPEAHQAVSMLGDLLLADKRYEEALQCFNATLLIQPDDIEILLRVGLCCHRLNDAPAAGRCYERILQLDPSHALARENLQVIISAYCCAPA